MDSQRKKLGDLGEKIAVDYLKKKGYKILENNYIPKFVDLQKSEVDIITEKEGIISFIEVKALSEDFNSPFLPQDKVNFLKQRKIIKAAEFYLLERKLFDNPWQIDVISLKIDSHSQKAKIQHLQNVVSGGT